MYKQLFLDSINVSEYVKNSTSQITDIHTTDQDLVLVEQFKNNDDYNNYRFLDFKWIPQLCLHRAVRTVKFQT
jgi:hypothetical protein